MILRVNMVSYRAYIGPNLKALEELLQRHVRVFANRAEAYVSRARNNKKIYVDTLSWFGVSGLENYIEP